MSAAFQTFKLKDVTLRNRIAVPPMCQYSAKDGFTNEWHWAHYAGLARGGAGLVVVEATGVSADGRITPGCTGLWKDEQIEGMARITAAIKAAGSVPGIQIGHAGRKASANLPWEGDDHIADGDPRGWETISPSAIPFGGGLSKTPREMTIADIERVKTDFVAAAKRALQAGFEWLELHFAHGYLAQSFFSVHANKRTDAYGGDAAGRSRFIIETFEAVRKVWPENLPLTARFGVIEFDGRDEETLSEAITLTKTLRDGGLDLMNVSMGFSTMDAKVPWGPSFLVPTTGRVRKEAGMPVASAWCVDAPQDIEKAVATGQMDIVMVGRAMLADPHYPYQVAIALGEERPAWTLPAPYAHWLSRYRGAGKGAAQ
ncbi:NADH:flavin oxidoreductase/NADH oxidase [Neorhizobium sp. NCHU2750]|uniref:NADH:flavin oxidoreductase/NADH oxidase n=1 Tax=Neorhizobium sp. NCHU2750 TaxID=1825976 RepID=UPI000E759247|nr:NADH-flavin oxidoreductase [Neorhizobium sp. NCHU2750]